MTTLTGSLDQGQVEPRSFARAQVQRAWATRGLVTNALAVMIVAVTAVQMLVPGVMLGAAEAGLVKSLIRSGEWWRLVTSAYLHGGLGHLASNVLVLVVLGRFVEAYTAASRIWLAFLGGVLVGSLTSLALAPAVVSVGASGGLLGVVGYLYAVGGDSAAATTWIRKQLRRLVLVTALYGIALYFMVDNATHAGGIAGGYLLGLIVTRLDPRVVDVCSRVAAVIVIAGAALATGLLLKAW
jgi:membrane associated rhomboid family serine protease